MEPALHDRSHHFLLGRFLRTESDGRKQARRVTSPGPNPSPHWPVLTHHPPHGVFCHEQVGQGQTEYGDQSSLPEESSFKK